MKRIFSLVALGLFVGVSISLISDIGTARPSYVVTPDLVFTGWFVMGVFFLLGYMAGSSE